MLTPETLTRKWNEWEFSKKNEMSDKLNFKRINWEG